MLQERLQIIMLYDFYGPLLTERQRQYIEHHFLEDWSLSEIAEEYGVSRQAVHDNLKRSEAILKHTDEKLKLLQRWQDEQALLRQLQNKLKTATSLENIGECCLLLDKILPEGRGDSAI